MPVNEAPWLTRRIEVIIMIATFMLCFFSDVLKCKTGIVSNCFGGSASMCEIDMDRNWCYDMVLPQRNLEEREKCACTRHNNSLLLFHVVDIGTLNNNNKKNTGGIEHISLAPLIAVAMKNITGNSISTNETRKIFNSNLYSSLSEDIGLSIQDSTICSLAPNKLDISYSYDSIKLDKTFSLLQDMEVSIPFKNDYFAIRRYFPGLYHTFEHLISRQATRPSRLRDSCAFVHLIIFILVRPGIDTTWVDENISLVSEGIIEAQNYVRKTMSRYLRTKPRYSRLLSSVWYIGVPMGYPLHNINENLELNVDKGVNKDKKEEKLASSSLNQNFTDIHNLDVSHNNNSNNNNLTSIFCQSSSVKVEECRDRCTFYTTEAPAYHVVNTELEKLIGNSGKRLGLHSILLPFHHFFNTNNTNNNNNKTLTLNWRDCLSLSTTGANIVAKKIAQSFFFS